MAVERSIRRSIIAGRIRAPPSVSCAHRMLFACSLAPGQTVLSNLPSSPHTDSTVSACNSFGADIVTEGGIADIFGAEEVSFPNSISCGESNTALKHLLPLISVFEKEVEITAGGPLSKKPLEPYVGYLERLGASIFTPSGFLPVRIKGPLTETQLVYLPSLGTQFLSGILLSSPLRQEDTEIGIEGSFASFEYVEQTLEIMRKSGISFSSTGPEYVYVQGGQSYSPPEELEVPPSAFLSSFLLLAGAVAGRVEVQGAPPNPDLEKLLHSFGAHAHFGAEASISNAGALESAELDAPSLGRLLPHALLLAALSSGETEINGTDAIRKSERVRLRIMVRELSKMGAKFDEKGGILRAKGGKLSGAVLEPEGDAACAMALSIAALAAGQSRINGADCVSGHYPGFFKDLSSMGALIR